MSENQKNRTSQDAASDEAKLEDETLNEVQGGIFGPGPCIPDQDPVNDYLKPENEKCDTGWEHYLKKRDGETPSR